jgi:1,4-alpha-glucan branching enzyme
MKPVQFYMSDPWLKSFTGVIDKRHSKCLTKEKHLAGNSSLIDFAMGHHYYGLHRKDDCWIFREWAPNAQKMFLIGVFTGWKERQEFMLKRIEPMGDWEISGNP